MQLIALFTLYASIQGLQSSTIIRSRTLIAPHANPKIPIGGLWAFNAFPKRQISSNLIGSIYYKIEFLLAHYHSYFMNASKRYAIWYNSMINEMTDDLKAKILSELNANLSSIRDLDSFWRETQGSYLKLRLHEIESDLTDLRLWINNTIPLYNRSSSNPVDRNMNTEERNTFLLNEYILVVENLSTGLKNHEDGRFTDVFKSFLQATVEKKKLDKEFNLTHNSSLED